MEQYLTILLHLVESAGLFGRVETATTKVADVLGGCQQSVSRKLIEMEKTGLIKRELKGNGMILSLDEKGRQYLSTLHRTLKGAIQEPVLTGTAKRGLGEGNYYMSLQPYLEQFNKTVGFKPFPGTFNIEVDPEKTQFFLNRLKPLIINGFNTKERTFGGLDCYKAQLNGVGIAIIKPHRSNHPETILEVIAPFNVRKKFGIKENQKVKITK